MARIDAPLERQVVSNNLFGQRQFDDVTVAQGGVQFPTPSRVITQRDRGYSDLGIKSLLRVGASVAKAEHAKQQNDDYLRGQMYQAQGKSEQEIRDQGVSKSTMKGYLDLGALSTVEETYQNLLAGIETEGKIMPPEQYQEYLTKQVNTLYTGNEENDLRMTKALAPMLSRLVGAQTKAHNAYNTAQTYQGYVSALMASGEDVDTLNALLKAPPLNGMSLELKQKAISEAAIQRAALGDTRLIELNLGVGVKQTKTGMGGTSKQSKHTPYTGDKSAGWLSAKYESNGKVGTIGRMSTDGLAFGRYQISVKPGTMKHFADFAMKRNPIIGKMLQDSSKWESSWRVMTDGSEPAVAKALEQLEQEFMVETHWKPIVSKLPQELQDKANVNPVLKEVFYAVAGGHGAHGGSRLIKSVYKSGMTDEQLVSAIYDKRKTQYRSSTAKERSGIQASLEKQKAFVLGELGTPQVQGTSQGSGIGGMFQPNASSPVFLDGMPTGSAFTPAQVSGMQAAYRQAWTAGSKRVNTELTTTRQSLISQVTMGMITYEQAYQYWDEAVELIKTSNDFKFGGDDLVKRQTTNLDVLFGRAADKHAKGVDTEMRLVTALANGDVSSLTTKEKQAAFALEQQNIGTKLQKIQADNPTMSMDELQTLAINETAKLITQYPTEVIKNISSAWTTSMNLPIGKDGEPAEEAKLALDQYMAVRQLDPTLADKYLGTQKSRSIMYTAAAMYQEYPDAKAVLTTAIDMYKSGTELKDVTTIVNTPTYKESINEAITDNLDSIEPWEIFQMLGVSTDVSDIQYNAALNDGAFRNAVDIRAGVLAYQNAHIPAKQIAEMAVKDVMKNTTFIGGKFITDYPRQNLKNDMGLGEYKDASGNTFTAYTDPMIAHTAFMEYIERFGAKEFNIPSFAEDLQDVQLMYNRDTKTFQVRALVDTSGWYEFWSDEPMYTEPVNIPARSIGEWYRQKDLDTLTQYPPRTVPFEAGIQ